MLTRSLVLAIVFLLVAGCGLLAPASEPTQPPTPALVEVTRLVTQMVTQVVVVTATPPPPTEPTPVPPPSPERVIFADDFSEGAGEWRLGDSENTAARIEDEALLVEVKADRMAWGTLNPRIGPLPAEYELFYDIHYVSGGEDPIGGVWLYFKDDKNYTPVWISLTNLVFYSTLTDNKPDLRLPWSTAAGIDSDHTRMHIVESGGRLQIFANDILVYDAPFVKPSQANFITFGVQTNGKPAVWAFDNIVVARLAP